MNYITFVGLRHNDGESNRNGLKIIIGDLHGHKNLQLVNEKGKIIGSMIGSQNKFNELINLGVDEEYLTLQRAVDKKELSKKEVKEVIKYEQGVYITIKIGDSMKEEVKEIIKFKDHYNERISSFEQSPEQRLQNKCTVVTYYSSKCWGQERRTEIDINKENIDFIKQNITRNKNNNIEKIKNQLEDLLTQKGEFDPYWVELYKHQTDYKAFVTEENEVYEIVGTGNDTVTYYAGNRTFENVKVEYRGEMPRNMYFWKAKLSKGTKNENKKGDNMFNEEDIRKMNDKVEQYDKVIEKIKETLEVAEIARNDAKIASCIMQSDIKLTAEVVNHKFSDEKCVSMGYTTMHILLKDENGNVINNDNIADYHNMPLLRGDDTTQYCCGMFQVNEACVAHHVYQRKWMTKWYLAIIQAIKEYLHDNHLGCGMCE